MIAITNGKVMTISQGTFEPGTVLVEGGRIVAVGPDLLIPEDAEVYDATGKVVMPGLIDAHCHVGLFADGIGWEHSDGNEMTDPITPHLRALDAVHPEDKSLPGAGRGRGDDGAHRAGQRQPHRRAVGLPQDHAPAQRRADGAARTGRHEDGPGREPPAGLRRAEKDAFHAHGQRRPAARCPGGCPELSGEVAPLRGRRWPNIRPRSRRATRMPRSPKRPERDLKLEALGQGAAPRDEGPRPRPPRRRHADRHPHRRGVRPGPDPGARHRGLQDRRRAGRQGHPGHRRADPLFPNQVRAAAR